MTALWLARHGQTDWNVAGRYQGQADPPLNATGRAQAEALAERLATRPPAGPRLKAIASSDLQRADHTARRVAERLGLPVHTDPRLREINLGAWEGMLLADIQAQYPHEWAARERDPWDHAAPGGETAAAVAARVWAAADDLARSFAPGPVLVVSHGFALATLLCRARRLPMENVYSLVPDNANLEVVMWAASDQPARPPSPRVAGAR